MTKRLKSILIGLLSVFAFLFAGVFFVGCCDVNYDNISLVADKGSVELDVGQTTTVTITIQGYQKGFSNRISTNSKTNEETDVFKVDETVYISDNTIRLTIRGVAGGSGQLLVQTLEANKTCSININVNQYTSTLSKANVVNYVSNQTDFVPDSGCFVFDKQTTNRDMTHYYILPEQQVDFSAFQLTSIDTTQNIANFENRTNGNVIYRNIARVDRFSLEKEEGENKLYRCYQNEKEEIDLVGQFYFLSVYNHTFLPNENGIATNVLSCLSPVYVLPDLGFSVTGSYLVDGNVDEFESVPSNIQIVPNNSKKKEYILRIEMDENDLSNDFSKVEFALSKSNNYAVIDYYEFSRQEDENKDVRYIKISQNSQKMASTEFSMEIYYDIAQEIEDESVRLRLDYDIDILIAPTTIYINGTTDPQKMTLYNYYLSPEFGWQDLFVEVLSNYSTSPTFDGVYFQFDSSALDLMINNTTVSSVETYQPGVTRLYKDLSQPFQIRGKIQPRGTQAIDDTVVKVFVVSNIVEQEGGLAPAQVHCTIIDGAREIRSAIVPQPDFYYLDVDGGTQTFDAQIYAERPFSFTTARCVSNVNGVEIDTHPENPYIEQGEQSDQKKYFINLSVTPRLTGTFTYTITLDNGISRSITFSCIQTLNTSNPPIRLTESGNEDVSRWSYSREGSADFDNVLNVEILNTSTKEAITFGSTADVEVTANVSSDGVAFAPNDSQYISVAKNSTFYRITTKGNGDTRITFTLSGFVVNNYERVSRVLTMYVDVSSYSIVQEFYLKNGSDYGLNNTVY